MGDSHFLDFSLELVDQVSALRPQHLNLRLKIRYLSLILLFGLLSLIDLLLFLSFQLGNILIEVCDLHLKFSDLVIEFLHLFMKIIICCFQDIIQPFNFGV